MDNLIQNITQSAKKRFPDVPFPHRKDEYWRFSDYAAWNTDALFPYFGAHTVHVANPDFDALEKAAAEKKNALTLLDGQIIFENVEESIEILPLANAAEKYPENFKKFYAQSEGKFDILNASKAGAGAYVKVADNAEVSLNFSSSSKLSLSIFGVIFEIGAGAKVKLIRDNAVYGGSFQVSRFAFFAGENSQIDAATFNFSDVSAKKYSREDFYLGANSKLRDAFAELGCSHTRNERNFNFSAANSNVDSRIFAAAHGEITHDIRTLQKHSVGDCFSNIALKTALYDSAKLAFSGVIRVEEEAQKTDAYLSSRSLLLSNDAQAQASPILEICANDVSCSHGCTVAKPDSEELFYMRQRGLRLDEAKRLIVEGFAENTFEHLSADSLREPLRAHRRFF